MATLSEGSNQMELTFGYSPCPNDTFMFHGIASGVLSLPGRVIRETLHDVETLNRMALDGVLDITKMSFHAWLMVRDRYRLLQSGAALGYGCGPVVISKRPLLREALSACRVVLPGEWTTAHLLFRMWAPGAADRTFVPYDRIFDEIDSGRADCGVIIHENRFTFEKAGFRALADLGLWWESETGMPIPLGCIAARESLGEETLAAVEDLIRRSILRAGEHPESALPYIRLHAREMDTGVLEQHIDTFVNNFSLDLGETGRAAVAVLEERARRAGVIS